MQPNEQYNITNARASKSGRLFYRLFIKHPHVLLLYRTTTYDIASLHRLNCLENCVADLVINLTGLSGRILL